MTAISDNLSTYVGSRSFAAIVSTTLARTQKQKKDVAESSDRW